MAWLILISYVAGWPIASAFFARHGAQRADTCRALNGHMYTTSRAICERNHPVGCWRSSASEVERQDVVLGSLFGLAWPVVAPILSGLWLVQTLAGIRPLPGAKVRDLQATIDNLEKELGIGDEAGEGVSEDADPLSRALAKREAWKQGAHRRKNPTAGDTWDDYHKG